MKRIANIIEILTAALLAVTIFTSCGDDEPTSGAGEKCKASQYKQVTIGDQTWMAENYRCSKYDTESEAYKAGIKSVKASTKSTMDAVYMDATNKSNWSKTVNAGSLSKTQLEELGYLYNWAAAVGVESSDDLPSSDGRQGICPNGWRVPTAADWSNLQFYIENYFKEDEVAGKHLKSKTGWLENYGNDTYGFNALPSGHAAGSGIYAVGENAFFWTSSSEYYSAEQAYYYYLSGGVNWLYGYSVHKSHFMSVRCIKNNRIISI